MLKKCIMFYIKTAVNWILCLIYLNIQGNTVEKRMFLSAIIQQKIIQPVKRFKSFTENTF